MADDDVKHSPDRKTRVEGDRVIHTPAGRLNDTPMSTGNPYGLTEEQAQEQRTGTKIDERHVREAARGLRTKSANEKLNGRADAPGEGKRSDSDELTDEPFGRKPEGRS